MPLTLAAPVHSELIIKKSRFIGCVQPMSDRAGALVIGQDLGEVVDLLAGVKNITVRQCFDLLPDLILRLHLPSVDGVVSVAALL